MNGIINAVLGLIVLVLELFKGSKVRSVVNENNCNVVVSNYRSNMCVISVASDELIGSWNAIYDMQKDIILISESLVGILSDKELQAVILHELGHRFHRNSHLSKVNRDEYALLIEYEADLYSCVHGHGEYLLSALEKIFKKHFQTEDLNMIDGQVLGFYNEYAKPRLIRIRRYLDG